jgi:serine/threonine protein kinase/tetratricopeptide (TPR) repeat protein
VDCGSTSRVERGLCLNCLLQRGLEPINENAETLDALLAEIDVPAAEWRLGNYQILGEIGRGGMGVIYRARQRHSGRIVAVKRLLGYHADSLETLARFRREAQAVASLDHPNILPIYEVSETPDGIPFFSMKFAAGGSLLEAGPTFRNYPRRCAELMLKVTRAVQYAHGKGVLHRDLKPGNILLDESDQPLITDFGLARWLDTTSNLTRTLTIFGTPGYIAPEQASDSTAPASPAADIYSLGAILFDLLAGRPPFLGAHALSVIRQAAEKPAPKLRTVSQLVDRDLETICARCLEREPSSRYASVSSLADDLESWIQGKPILARPVSSPVRTWRWTKRNPKLALSILACFILGALGITERITSLRLSSMVQNAELERHSVTVIPLEDLEDLSTGSDSARATMAMLTGELSHSKAIQLRPTILLGADALPRSLIESWRQIGEKAKARMIIAGTVRQRAGQQRLALHLIDASSGSMVRTWLEDADSSLALAQEANARIVDYFNDAKIASETSASLERRRPSVAIGGTTDLTAQSYYERGTEFFFRYNLPDQKRAIDSFRKAIELDSNYALAYAMLASACQARSVVDPGGKWLDEAETATATALRIAPMLAEAHRAQAGNLRYKGFLRESIDSYLTAYELDPSSGRAAATLGDIYDLVGRPDLAVAWFQRAMQRETRPVYADNLADAYVDLTEYEMAENAYQTAAEFRPDLPVGVLGLSRLALLRGDYETARAECIHARAKYAGNPEPLILLAQIEFFNRNFSEAEKLYRDASELNHLDGLGFPGAIRFASALGFIRQTTGSQVAGKTLLEGSERLDANELVKSPANPRLLYSRAATNAAIGSTALAKRQLEQAIAAGWIDYRSVELDPRFDSIRDAAQVRETLRQLREKVAAMRERVRERVER